MEYEVITYVLEDFRSSDQDAREGKSRALVQLRAEGSDLDRSTDEPTNAADRVERTVSQKVGPIRRRKSLVGKIRWNSARYSASDQICQN